MIQIPWLLYQFLFLQEGESAKVDSLLAIIGPAGTDVSGVASRFIATSAPAKKEEAPKGETKKEASKGTTSASSTPKTSAPAPTPVTENGRLYVSPLAKKLAEEKGISFLRLLYSARCDICTFNFFFYFRGSIITSV